MTTTAPSTRPDQVDLAALVARREPGRPLESPFYTSPDVFAADVAGVLAHTWLFVATAAELREPGDFLTVHGEPQVMAAAVKGCAGSGLKILAVTVLTSLTDADLAEMGHAEAAGALVERRIRQAIAAGCDGVVASFSSCSK